jgi:ABC-type dipeptide/oligopeptide/nickel transport system permease subunit
MASLRCWPRVWCVLRRDARVQFGGLLLTVIVALAIGAPILSADSPLATDPAGQLLPPGPAHLAGTDLLGRDVWSRLLWGGRLSLAAGMMASLLAAVPGSLLGLLSGYAGGHVDALLMRVIDVLLAFPSLLLALAIVAWLGPGLPSATLAVGLAGIPRFARVTRASALLVRGEPFIEAARVIGCRPVRIMLRHAAPNVLDTVVVLGSLELGYALLNVAALGFLGLGAQAPVAEWGLMLTEGRAYMRAAPWISAFPGAAITLSVLAVNLLGDALRDALGFQSRT